MTIINRNGQEVTYSSTTLNKKTTITRSGQKVTDSKTTITRSTQKVTAIENNDRQQDNAEQKSTGCKTGSPVANRRQELCQRRKTRTNLSILGRLWCLWVRVQTLLVAKLSTNQSHEHVLMLFIRSPILVLPLAYSPLIY